MLLGEYKCMQGERTEMKWGWLSGNEIRVQVKKNELELNHLAKI